MKTVFAGCVSWSLRAITIGTGICIAAVATRGALYELFWSSNGTSLAGPFVGAVYFASFAVVVALFVALPVIFVLTCVWAIAAASGLISDRSRALLVLCAVAMGGSAGVLFARTSSFEFSSNRLEEVLASVTVGCATALGLAIPRLIGGSLPLGVFDAHVGREDPENG